MIQGAGMMGAGDPNFYNPLYSGDVLEQPAEYGAGIAYTMGANTFAFDYKKIKWSSAEGYSDFGWEDQNVFAFGYQYAQDNWALRAGYNYASSAVVEQSGAGQMNPAFMAQSANNFFNLLCFPATAERHFTLGGSYDITEAISVDLAYVYSPTNTETFQTGAFGNTPPYGFGLTSIETSHQEDSLSFQLTFNF
jgi:long-chain fatty acid transport protein